MSDWQNDGPMEKAQSISTRLALLAHASAPYVPELYGPPKATSLPREHLDIGRPVSSMRELILPVTYLEEWAQSLLPIETFLHIQTWHFRYPQFRKEYSLELNVTYADCGWASLRS